MTVIEVAAQRLTCARCGLLLGLLTAEVLEVKFKDRFILVFPGSTVTIACKCGERRHLSLPVKA